MKKIYALLIRTLSFMLTVLLVYLLTSSVLVSASSISPAPGLTSEEITFQGGGGIMMHGTIIKPASAKAGMPGVVLVHGSGSGPRSNLLAEATAFAQNGLCVLIYDKRTVGYSDFQRSYSQLADDALGAVRTLRTQSYIDPEKVGIWGISEGAWVAPLAASRSSDIAFVIVVGGNAMTPLQQQTWSVANALHRKGISGSLINQAESKMFRLLANIGLFAEAHYDAKTVLEHVKQPLLGIWGTNDQSTPPGENPPLFANALQQGGNTHYTFRFFPGADHSIHQTPDSGITSLPSFTPGYSDLVSSWIGDVTNGKLPNADASIPPQQDWKSVPVPPSFWWESSWPQFITLILMIMAFVGYLLVSLIRRIRNRSLHTKVNSRARVLAVVGTITVLGFIVYIINLLRQNPQGIVPGPILLDRPLLWLFLQMMALSTAGTFVVTIIAWIQARDQIRLGERIRLGFLVAGGAIFVLWALYWGLLLP